MLKHLIRKIIKESENEFDWVDSLHFEDINENLFNFLIQEYPVRELPSTHENFPNKKYIIINKKPVFIEDNKKYLLNKIYLDISEDFGNIIESTFRRTIRKFLNDIMGN
jgi:hypothetical protein